MSDTNPMPRAGGWGTVWKEAFFNRRLRLVCYLVILGLYAVKGMYRDLGERPLRADELIFTGVIDQMHADGDWIYPKHTSGVPYVNKPPLYMWLSTLTYDAFGEGRFKYRFWSATFGVGCVLTTVLLGARLFGPEVGGLAGWILTKNDLFVRDHGARMATFDTAITFFAALCFLFYWTSARRRGGWAGWTLAGLAAAGISLLKPFFGIPFLGVVSVHYLLTGKRWIDIRRLRGPILATTVSLVVVAPWYALQWQRYGELYTNAIFWANYIDRAEGTLHPDHIRPMSFYVETMSDSSFLLFVPALAWCGLLAFRGRKHSALRFSLFVTASTVALFSVAKCKLHWYVFPVYPLAAILIGVGPVWVATRMAARFGWAGERGFRRTVLPLDGRAIPDVEQPARHSA